MRKATALILTIFLLGAVVAVPAAAQTAQDVLNKLIDAQGGRKFLGTIKDTTLSGSLELIPMGISGTITIFQKEPNKMRMDMELMGMLVSQGFDGKTAWGTNMQTGVVEEMPEAQAKEFGRQAMGNDSFLNPEKYGITFALKPDAELDGKEYIVLEQTLADGFKITIYLDPVTYLPFRSDMTAQDPMTGAEVMAETYFSDYRKVGDGVAAHSMKVHYSGAEFMRMTFSSIAYNNKLQDSLFGFVK